LRRVLEDLGVSDVDPRLERPRETSHGDVATNVAMQLAGRLRQAPRTIAEDIAARIDVPADVVTKVEIAGPGFINFWLADSAVADIVHTILARGSEFGRSAAGQGRSVNVEFVSANPTGPLHVGHGRGAALGDAIAAVLEATGHEVTREFYINDAGLQIDRMAESLWARVQQEVGREARIPPNGYHGEYLVEMAREILASEGKQFADQEASGGIARCREIGVRGQREEQGRDLEAFGVAFDVYFSETSLYDGGAIEETLAELERRGVLYEHEGALWLRTTRFGDDKDRVLRKSDGTYTYFTPDIAYHRTKAARGANLAIDVWGADHHGYINRMRAALTALGLPEGFFHVALVQLVRVMRHGEEVRFSKRSGEFVTLRDLFEQAGVDAARYFFLMRKGDAQFVFDIDLATRQTEENPVYYVQYAHTRMAGIFRTAALEPTRVTGQDVDLSCLGESDEQELMKRLAEYPKVVEKSAETLEPHRIIGYLEDVARLVNGWYHRHRVLGEDDALMQARLGLARAAQIVLANGLTLLGISAPERM
jgi:arginyl-tRNA synthetase